MLEKPTRLIALKQCDVKHSIPNALHYCLSRNAIPVELRDIIKNYLLFQFDNQSLKSVVKLWCGRFTRQAAFEQYGHISHWDISKVTDISELFLQQCKFNDDISQWDVGNVTNMSRLFYFYGDTKWMTSPASSYIWPIFDQPLNGWDVSNVTDMSEMLKGLINFNQPLDKWDLSNVQHKDNMFDSNISSCIIA